MKTLQLTHYEYSPTSWHNFVEYVRICSDQYEWNNSESGEGSYTYNRIIETLESEWKCNVTFKEEGGIDIEFPTEGTLTLFHLKYA